MEAKHSKNVVGDFPDVEKQPLLPKSPISEVPSFGAVDVTNIGESVIPQEDDCWDSQQYEMPMVNSWRILLVVKGGAFDNESVLKCMTCSLLVSLFVAYGSFQKKEALFIPIDKVQKLSTFLNVFVGMLLGFFLRLATNHYYGCIHGYTELLEAVRCMHMQMIALGVDAERIDLLNRYGLLSAWLVHISLNINCRSNPKFQESPWSDDSNREKMWRSLMKHRPYLVLPGEMETLSKHKDSYALVWTWIASLLGRMAQNGEIPPMESPTYGRILNIVEMAYASIRQVRMVHRIKAPFIYAHTLAILVHFNTIVNSFSFGIILGMTLQVAVGKDNGRFQQDLPHLIGSIFMQWCISMVAPWMFLTLLELCVCISQPFTFLDSKIPSLHLVRALEEDLASASLMGDSTKWKKPCYKK